MLTLPRSVRIVLATEPVDMRRGHDGLCAIVRNRGSRRIGLPEPAFVRSFGWFTCRPVLARVEDANRRTWQPWFDIALRAAKARPHRCTQDPKLAW